MGIHVHWHAYDSVNSAIAHYYSRDTSRTFDEDIDENTLVTDICTVSDGSAHDGTVGATILQTDTMAIWTDPNYGFSLTDPNFGLWQPRFLGSYSPILSANIDSHVGMLDFIGEDVVLNVGGNASYEQVPVNGIPGNLTDVPYFYFNFLGDDRGSTQRVIVNGTWNYYGLVDTHDATTSIPVTIGSPFTNGDLVSDESHNGMPAECGGGIIQIGTYADVSADDFPGTLIVHAGANFFCGEWTSFTVTPDENNVSGDIDVLYGGDVFPIWNSGHHIADTTGMLTLDGKTILQRSSQIGSADTGTWWNAGGCLRGHIPIRYFTDGDRPAYQAEDVILYIGEVWDPGDHLSDPTGVQFEADNFDYFNTTYYSWSGGKSEIRIGCTDPFYPSFAGVDNADGGPVTFNGGIADAIEIHMLDPNPIYLSSTTFSPVNYTIENMTFNDIRGEVILIESDQEPSYDYFYGHIQIMNNSFGSFADDVGWPTFLNGEDYPVTGIYSRNFNSEGYSDGQIGPIDIIGNQFTGSNCNHAVDDDDAACVAIKLENTTANVENNVIKDPGYNVGISIIPKATSPVNSLSLICSNDIENLATGCVTGYTSPLAAGIKSSSGEGYVKLNTITGNDIGYWALIDDNPKLIFNSITANSDFQIRAHIGSIVDMTGVHGTGVDLAAFNTVSGASTDINSSDAPQVILIDGVTSNVLVGQFDPGWSNFGKNNLTSTTTSTYQPVIVSKGTINLLNIDDNFWGIGVRPDLHGASPCANCYWTSSGSSGPVNAEATTTHTLSYVCNVALDGSTSLPDVSCGTGWGGGDVTDKGAKPQLKLKQANDTLQACNVLYMHGYEAHTKRQWQLAFDTLTRYIESCANNPSSRSPAVFPWLSSAVVGLHGSDGGTYRETYLGWLESVLYLNTNEPEYFCADVEAMAGFLPLTHDTMPGYASRWDNEGLAVINWLIHNSTCDTPYLAQEYDQERQTQLEQWANNPTAYKLDTTLPPLSTWGLDTLLAKHFLYASVDNPKSIILNATASPNPVNTGTIITFGINQEAYVKINLFDLLGHEVTSPGYQGLFAPGNHAVPLSLQGLPSGTYYARILTAFGSVATVKLVKE